MRNALQEQLLRSGLVKENKKENAIEKPKQNKTKKKPRRAPEVKQENTPIQQSTTQKPDKELRNHIKKLLRSNKLNDKNGEIAFNYVIKNQVKRFYINSQQQQDITDGKLAVVNWNDISYLIPADALPSITQIFPALDYFISTEENKSNSNKDDYSDYQIPDDMIW